MEIGYTFEFHELFIYKKSEKIYEKHIKALAYSKIKYSDLPDNLSFSQKQELCDKINEEMNFENQKLTPEDLVPNPAKRKLYKSLLNQLFGQPAINPKKYLKTKFVANNEELQNLLKTLKRKGPNGHFEALKKIEPIGSMVKIVLENGTKDSKSQRTCVILSAYTASYARIYVHKIMRNLENDHCRLLYVDCDSFYFGEMCGSSPQLPVGHAFGQFRNLYPGHKLLSLASLGPKSLSLQIKREEDGAEISDHKISGFKFTQPLPSGLKHSDYVNTVKAVMDHAIKPIKVSQKQKSVKKLRIQLKPCNKTLGKKLGLKRVLKMNHETYPFGYVKK